MTFREQFDSAMKCKNRTEAKAWLESEIIRYWDEFRKPKDEAERIILVNLGYMAGYYDDSVARKVYRLFKAEHPIFGPPRKARKLSPENVFRLGQEMAGKRS